MKGKKSAKEIDDEKKELAEGSINDYKLILNAYASWKNSNGNEAERDQKIIHQQHMKMVDDIRKLIMRHLTTHQFMMNGSTHLNAHSENWPVIKACIAIGLYRKYN